MSIKFNRQSVQEVWAQKSARSSSPASDGAGDNPLAQALADNKLSSEEYDALKADFLKEHPGEDFDRFLSDALDGKLDNRSNAELRAAVDRLASHDDHPVSVSFNLNADQDGYAHTAALSQQGEAATLQALTQADADHNGRIDDGERAALRQALQGRAGAGADWARTQVNDRLATITYDSAKQTITTYLGAEAPHLDGRFKDVRATLDLDLQDLDGITDQSKNDLKGKTSGQLDFDMDGPLVNSLKGLLANASGDYAHARTTWVSADQEGGPGIKLDVEIDYAPDAHFMIKSDDQGRLFVESDGVVGWAAIKAAQGLVSEHPMADQGYDFRLRGEGSRIYIEPGAVHLQDIPLSMSGQASGELNLGLTPDNTRFSLSRNGIRAQFTEVPTTGSSDRKGTEAQADAQADHLQGRFQVGLNADTGGNVDVQVVAQDAHAEVHLDADEMAKVQQIPEMARKYMDSAEGDLYFRGQLQANDQGVQGDLAGKVDLKADKGDSDAELFTHFRTGLDSKHSDDAYVALAGTDLRASIDGDQARLHAETGHLDLEGDKPLDFELFHAGADVEINQKSLEVLQSVLNSHTPAREQLLQALTSVGLGQDFIQRLTQGDSQQLQSLLQQPEFLGKLKTVTAHLNATTWQLQSDRDGVRAQAQDLSLEAHSQGNAAQNGAELSVQGQAKSMNLDYTGAGLKAGLNQASGQVGAAVVDDQGQVRFHLSGQAEALSAQNRFGQGLNLTAQDTQAELNLAGDLPSGTHLDGKATVSGLNAESETLGDNHVQADSAALDLHYTDQRGTAIDLTQSFHQVDFQAQADGHYTLTVPNAETRAQVETRLSEIRRVLDSVGIKALGQLQKLSDPAEVAKALQASGVPASEAQSVAHLMQNPQLRQMLAQADFVSALQRGDKVSLQVASRTQFSVKGDGQAQHSEVNSDQIHLQADLQDAQGQTVLSGKGDLNDVALLRDRSQDGGQTETQLTAQDGQFQAQGLRADGREFARVEGQVTGLSAERDGTGQVTAQVQTAQGSASYQDSNGTQLNIQSQLQNLSFSRQSDGRFELKVPSVQSQLALDADLSAARKLLEAVGIETLSHLQDLGSPEAAAQALQDKGLPADQAQAAASLLWKPHLQALLGKSDFIEALAQAEKIHIAVDTQAALAIQSDASGLKASLDSERVGVRGDLQNAEGQKLVAGEGELQGVHADYAAGTVNLTADQGQVDLTGQRADGSPFVSLSARASSLKAELGAESQSLSTGAVSAHLDANTQLKPEKVAEIRKLLSDFRDNINARLQALGLNRQQFEQIVNAFGREQLQKIFQSANPAQLSQISEQFGISQTQISQMLDLLNDQQFRSMVDNMYQFSQVLEGAQARAQVDLSLGDTSFSHRDAAFLSSLHQISGSAQIDTEGAQGQAHFQVRGTQEELKTRQSGADLRMDWGKFTGDVDGQVQDKSSEHNPDGQLNAGSLEALHRALATHAEGVERLRAGLDSVGISAEQQQILTSGKPEERTALLENRDFMAKMTQLASRLDLHAHAEGGVGSLEQQGSTLRSHFEAIDASGQANMMTADGSLSHAEAGATLASLDSHRDTQHPDDFEVTAQDLQAKGKAQIVDAQTGQETRAEAKAGMGKIRSSHEGLAIDDSYLEGTMGAQKDVTSEGQARQATAALQGQIEMDHMHSDAGKVTIDQTRVDGQLGARINEGDQVVSGLTARVDKGRISHLTAQQGAVDIERVQGHVSGGSRTQMVDGELAGDLDVKGLHSTKDGVTAQGFDLDAINGTLKVSTHKMEELLKNSPDALKILGTISRRWGDANGIPEIFTNDQFTIQLEDGSLHADGRGGDALRGDKTLAGHLRLPELQTNLGTADFDLRLDHLTVDSQGEPPEVELTGQAHFKPKQPAFNTAVNELVQNSLKDLGVNMPTDVRFENGKFQVKIDKWYLDGLVNIGFEGDRVNVSIDRAKLLRLINVPGLAARITESKMNHYLLDIDRQGSTLSLSLNEISEQVLHKDNLQIQGVNVNDQGEFEVNFAYTDTPEYNAAARQRGEARIQDRLFTNPRTGRARSDSQIEDVVEELEAPVMQKIFRNASPAQLDRILKAVGGDNDVIIREKVIQDDTDLALFTPENRAIMAKHLADSRGLFEYVDSSEEGKIIRLLNSLKPQETEAFMAQLSEAQLSKILKEIEGNDHFKAPETLSRLYTQLQGPSQRDKLTRAVWSALDEDDAVKVMEAIRARTAPQPTGSSSEGRTETVQPSFAQMLFTIQADDRLEEAVDSLSVPQLRQVMTEASPAQLRRMLQAVGNDYDNLLRKALSADGGAGAVTLERFSPENRAIMAAYLASDSGFLESVDRTERAWVQRLYASVASHPAEKEAFEHTLQAQERQRIESLLEASNHQRARQNRRRTGPRRFGR